MRYIAIGLIVLTAGISVYPQTGRISGRLTYPGQGIPPDIVVCVRVVDAVPAADRCSTARKKASVSGKARFQVEPRRTRYSVTLPAGRYQVYATTGEMPGRKAFYDEFIRCGATLDCRSKAPVTVRVSSGKTTSGITVGNFYD